MDSQTLEKKGQAKQPRALPGTEPRPAYPRETRFQYFAMWYIRRMYDDRIGNQLGVQAYALLTLIVTEEDRFGYRRGVDFYNQQIMRSLGIGSEHTLIKIRQKCVQAGLLHYEGSPRREAGIYWVIAPLDWSVMSGDHAPTQRLQNMQSSCSDPDSHRAVEVTAIVQSNCQPSIPSPVPNPIPKPSPPIPKEVAGESAEIELLEKRLVDLDLHTAGETIHEAMAHGTTLSQLNAIVDYYESRPGAWRPGALRRRLIQQSAKHMQPDRGWVDPDRIAESREKQRRKSTILVDRQPVSTPAVAKAAVAGLKGTQLEFEFGPILDRMSAEDLQRLVAEKKPALVPMLMRYGSGPKWMRASLLGVIATAAEPSR